MPIQATLENITRPGGMPQAGDSFRVLIFTSEPNQAVFIEGGQTGKPPANTPVGSTDIQGRLVLQNTWREGDIGAWTQNVYYMSPRGKEIAPLNLTVSPRSNAPASNGTQVQQIDNGGVLEAIVPSGFNMQTLLLLAAAVGLGWFISSKSGD